MPNNEDHRILSFDRDQSFFHKRALRNLDKSDYLQALEHLRRALEKQPHNIEYRLDMADTYARMGLYEKSNQVLMRTAGIDDSGEALFALGCNYMELGEYEQARTAFEGYLTLAPEGEYAEDALDISEQMDEIGPLSQAITWSEQGREALEAGGYEHAVRCFKKALMADPAMDDVRLNMGLCYFLMEDYPKALSQTRRVLEGDNQSVQAMLNMVLFLSQLNRREEAQEYLDRALAVPVDEPDVLFRLIIAMDEMDMAPQDMLLKTQKLLIYRPHDMQGMHMQAALYMRQNDFTRAAQGWANILRLDPGNAAAAYYLRLCKQLGESSTDREYHIPLPMEIPVQHILRIGAELTRLLSECGEEKQRVADLFDEDEELRGRVRWALGSHQVPIRHCALALLGTIATDKAVEMLKDQLVLSDISDAFKREVLSCLKAVDAPEPYVAYMGRALVQVKVGEIEHVHMPRAYRRVMNEATQALTKEFGAKSDVSDFVTQVWATYVGTLGSEFPRLKVEPWVGALEALYRLTHSLNAGWEELCEKYDTTERTLKMRVRKLKRAMEGLEEET